MNSRIFKTRLFARQMQKIGLSDELLLNAVDEMERGLIDADLGGGVVKKRVALPNRGKSGSTRTLIATNKNDRWFFMFGFEKNQRDNIDKTDLKALKEAAKTMLNLSEVQLNLVLKTQELTEIYNGN
ncbi:MAG: type II toxin-antitoxin system RelE/ParE family toxin [Methylococcales bacterium]|nr:type II toxin-antitoxin system RelE/ParE family toxin [Methylococcales bacterium]